MDRQAKPRIVAGHHVPSFHLSIIPSEGLRLIDEHDGDVVLDRVNQPAVVTDERFGWLGAVLERAFAFRADENLEQVGGETHEAAYPRRLIEGSSRRHLGSTFTCMSRNTRWPSNV